MQTVRTTLATLALAAAAAAQSATTAATAQSPADELAALTRRFEQAEGSYSENYAAFKPEYEAFARRREGTEEGLTAELWLLQQCWWLRSEGTMEEAAKALAEHILDEHRDSPQLARVAEFDYVFGAADRAKILARLRASSHAPVRAMAVYQLAKRARGDDQRALYQELARDYGELPCRHTTFGALADAGLNPHPAEALAIGSMAPDIEGVDVDGNAMKLSDYRGKVVVLDFWGDW